MAPFKSPKVTCDMWITEWIYMLCLLMSVSKSSETSYFCIMNTVIYTFFCCCSFPPLFLFFNCSRALTAHINSAQNK